MTKQLSLSDRFVIVANPVLTTPASISVHGIRKSPEKIRQIADIISPLILRGQSLNHICATHGHELGISELHIV